MIAICAQNRYIHKMGHVKSLLDNRLRRPDVDKRFKRVKRVEMSIFNDFCALYLCALTMNGFYGRNAF